MMKNGLHGEVLKIIDFRLNRKVFVIQRSNQIQDDFIRNLRMVFLVMLVDDDAVEAPAIDVHMKWIFITISHKSILHELTNLSRMASHRDRYPNPCILLIFGHIILRAGLEFRQMTPKSSLKCTKKVVRLPTLQNLFIAQKTKFGVSFCEMESRRAVDSLKLHTFGRSIRVNSLLARVTASATSKARS